MNKHFNIYHTAGSEHFVTLQKALTKVLKSEMGQSVISKVPFGMQKVRDDLKSQSKNMGKYCLDVQGSNKYTLFLHKFHAVPFPDDDMKVNLTAPTITFFGIKEYELFNIISELVCGMIYEKNKKEKRVMVHKEIHKFDDATLKKVLEGFEKYNKDVKYGYADLSPSKHHAKLLRYYEEDIIECWKHRDQMRRWEMYVNERPLGSRRDCPV
nr:hypothetical protein [Tanacetum cinerariifolium]